MRYLILLSITILTISTNAQYFNSDATPDVFSINLIYGQHLSQNCRDAVDNELQQYIDEFNKREKKAFTFALNDVDAPYFVDIYLDSLKPCTKGRKALAWTFFGLGFPCLLVPPVGIYVIYTSLAHTAADRVYMKTVLSENMRGEDYREITHMKTYNALFIHSDEERTTKHCEKLPKMAFKVARYAIYKANGFYLDAQKK